MNAAVIRKELLAWYRRNKRSLPWRETSDPYRIWISEVMLQQTQVDTVIPYYMHWMSRFPDLVSLAAAQEQDVLQVWEGLGYYSRARNILRCAKVLISEHGGQLPRDVSQLEALPGIGTYMVGAIVSIAFGIKAPALDGNLKRVLARLSEFSLAINEEKNAAFLRELLVEILPEKDPGDVNQAFMDLGATICLPRNPQCANCPLRTECSAFQKNLQNDLPVKAKKPPVPHYQVSAAVIIKEDKTLIDLRNANGLLGGLWEFPGGKVETGETLPEALIRELREELGVEVAVGEALGIYRHAYTHFKVTVNSFRATIIEGEPKALQSEQVAWVEVKRLGDYPMGKVDRMIARELQKKVEADSAT